MAPRSPETCSDRGVSSTGPLAGIAFLGGRGASKNAWTVAGLSTLAQGLLRGPRQSQPFSAGIAISSGRLRLMPCGHTFAPRSQQWHQTHVSARRQTMTHSEPLADLYVANQRMDAPAPNAHSRVATLELTVTARAHGAASGSPNGDRPPKSAIHVHGFRRPGGR